MSISPPDLFVHGTDWSCRPNTRLWVVGYSVLSGRVVYFSDELAATELVRVGDIPEEGRVFLLVLKWA